MPFGLMNAPTTFQAAMNLIFMPYLRGFVLVFFDDILVFSNDWSNHLSHLSIVLQTLQQHHFVANQKKYCFGKTQVEYLGHIISRGVEADPAKVKSVLEWPMPSHVKRVHGFLGLTGYYRKFIASYGKITKPWTQLAKKGEFQWNDEAQMAFESLKLAITSAPVLSLPNFSQQFELECDSSEKGLGAVLMQQGKPVAFFSKALSDTQLSKSIYEKELTTVVSHSTLAVLLNGSKVPCLH